MGRADRDAVYAAAAELGWSVAAKPNSSGYFKVLCPCGRHKFWLHKSPSNPNYFSEKVRYMRRLGCVAPTDQR